MVDIFAWNENDWADLVRSEQQFDDYFDEFDDFDDRDFYREEEDDEERF